MAKTSPLRSPVSLVLVVFITAVVLTILHGRIQGPRHSEDPPDPCLGQSLEECRAVAESALQADPMGREPTDTQDTLTQVLLASEVCVDVGYLCAEVERSDSLRILRWPDGTSLIRVWVPLPQGVAPSTAQALQRAAVNGIQSWHEHPIPLSVSTRSVPDTPDITVHWSRTLGGNRLGHARMSWRRVGAEITVEIPDLQLATHDPRNPELEMTPDQIRLVAAHEMGHALGLPHSDDPSDVMYPQNTAWRRTRRDFQTMEALYRMPNGALIKR